MTDKNSIYDECNDVAIFNKNIQRFYTYIIELPCFSEFIRIIKKSYKFYKNEDRKNYIIKVIDLMTPHITYISQYNEGIFSNDYVTGSMKIIPGLDFKLLFKTLNSSPEFTQYKKPVFTHLHTIYISAEMAKGQLCKFNKVLKKQKELLLNMIKNLGIDETLKEKIEKLEKEEADEEARESESSWFDFSKFAELKEIFGEDNPIAKLAKDIIAEVNISNLTAENLTENFGEKIQNLIKVFLQKIQAKFMSGEIDIESLSEEVNKIIEKVTKIFPGLKEYINPETLREMFEKTKKKPRGANNVKTKQTTEDSASIPNDDECNDDEGNDDEGDDVIGNINFDEISNDIMKTMSQTFTNNDGSMAEMSDTLKSLMSSLSSSGKSN